MAQASELSQMHVADLRGSQLSRQGLPVEVSVVSRAGDTAYIYDALDAVRSEKIEEVFPCAIRMSNRQDNGLFDFDPSHDDYPFRLTRGRHTKQTNYSDFSLRRHLCAESKTVKIGTCSASTAIILRTGRRRFPVHKTVGIGDYSSFERSPEIIFRLADRLG